MVQPPTLLDAIPSILAHAEVSQGSSRERLSVAGSNRRAMSILDFAEDPNYQLVAVALSVNDAAVIFGVKKDKLRPVLEIAIEMLQAELDKLPPKETPP